MEAFKMALKLTEIGVVFEIAYRTIFFDFVDDVGSKNNYSVYKIEVYQPKLT